MGVFYITMREEGIKNFICDVTKVIANGMLPRRGETITIENKKYVVLNIEHDFTIKTWNESENLHMINIFVRSRP